VIFEKYEVADISTGYLEESDLELLLRFDCPTRFAETDGGFGTFHWVPDDDCLFEEDMQHAAEFGLSERFIAIMRHLRAARIPYARFDANGGEIEGIEITDTTESLFCREAEDKRETGPLPAA
jgi:hypothetical protein